MNDWILLQQGAIIYLSLFLALLGGAVGLPIPEDIPLILAGILAQRRQAELDLLVLSCYSGAVLGDLIIFSIGRRFGPTLFDKEWIRRRLSHSKVRRVRVSLERRSLVTIFVARHLFYLRTITFLTCGAVKMDIRRFLLADAAAALISVPLIMSIGYLAAEHLETALLFMKRAKYTLAILSLIFFGVAVYAYRRKRAARKLEQEK